MAFYSPFLVFMGSFMNGCGGSGGGMNIPDNFDLDTALELGRLCLQAYQMLDDFRDGRNFELPPPFTLEMVFCTRERFVGESIDTDSILDKQFCTREDEVPIAFIATTGEEIFVVFRGTDTIDEWIKDAEFFQVPYTFVPDGGKTEEGFTKVYNSIHESIVDKVNDLIESENFTTLFVTGHSLGAALATLAIPELIENTAFSQPIMYNFASPRVGDATFMRLYDSLIDNSLRVYNTRDEVPTLPPRFLGYTHVKTGTAIVFGKPIRDPFDFERIEDNHIMCNYYNELCDLTSDPEACKEMAGGADGCNA